MICNVGDSEQDLGLVLTFWVKAVGTRPGVCESLPWANTDWVINLPLSKYGVLKFIQ